MDKNYTTPYEISLWEDILVYPYCLVDDEEKTVFESYSLLDGNKYLIGESYYKDELVAVIGSDTMTAQSRALDPKWVSNINGSHNLSFTMQLKYFDSDIGEFVENPYAGYLVNERKVKLKYKDEWYDLLIKRVTKTSDNLQLLVECEDLYINELSKNGFNVEFNIELKNNSGTVEELAESALRETDWSIDLDSTEIIQQRTDEALYSVILNKNIVPQIMQTDEYGQTILEGTTIYVFADSIRNKKTKLQFLYEKDYSGYIIDNIIQSDRDEIHDYYFNVSYDDNGIPDISKNKLLSPAPYKGQRLVESNKTIYDPLVERTVNIYSNENGDILYGYTNTSYQSPIVVKNLLTNSENYQDTSGWIGTGTDEINIAAYPPLTEPAEITTILGTKTTNRQISLQLTTHSRLGIRNTGLVDNTPNEGIIKDKYYVFHTVSKDTIESSQYVTHSLLDVNIYKYEIVIDEETGRPMERAIGSEEQSDTLTFVGYLNDKLEGLASLTNADVGSYKLYRAKKTITYNEIKTGNYGLYVHKNSIDGSSVDEYITKIEFFPYYETNEAYLPDGNNGYKLEKFNAPVVITPENQKVESKIISTERYYAPDNVDESGEVIYFSELPEGQIPDGYKITRRENFEKVRSIEEKESNRFNIIQSLCETFECWAKFKILHNEDGTLKRIPKLDSNGEQIFQNGVPVYKYDKRISFHNYIGRDNDAGFKRGINLKNISRKVESNKLTSKLIVKSNNNEMAENGFCSIARAQSSPTKETSLYNFDYYIQMGLIDGEVLRNDLFLTGGDIQGYLGYYPRLREINDTNEALNQELSQLQSSIIPNTNSQKQVYERAKESSLEEFNKIKESIESAYIKWDDLVELSIKPREELDNTGYKEVPRGTALNENQVYFILEGGRYIPTDKGWANTDALYEVNRYNGLTEKAIVEGLEDSYYKGEYLLRQLKEYNDSYDKLLASEIAYSNRIDEIKAILEGGAREKQELNKKFYEKYSRFIQEGTWMDENYIDDELYYLDAENVLATSTTPNISYTINVVDVSPLPGYDLYNYQVGDKTYVEDIEFFGYNIIDGIKTPYQEEVVLAETTEYFEDSSKNSFKVQNYKTQFEDLFQRITSTTQQVEFNQGAYDRVSSIVSTNGVIKENVLQAAIENNNDLVLQNNNDQSVTWDKTGITVTSLTSPNKMVRLVSGGIYISSDGGKNWTSGMTGTGVNASVVTAGLLDTNKIQIMNGNYPAFIWDKNGISSYWFNENGFDFNKFVRFDKYGIYGHIGEQNFIPSSIDDVVDNSVFSLTWNGFNLNAANQKIKIDSDYGIRFIEEGVNRLIIGKLSNGDETIYGFSIQNADGVPVLQTEENGQLWLKDRLNIGSPSTNQVGIGNLGKKTSEKNEVFNANDNFVVYEDGSILATNGKFTGEINATSGKIGNMSISGFANIAKQATTEIVAENGTSFKISADGAGSPSRLVFSLYDEEYMEDVSYIWQIASVGTDWEILSEEQNCELPCSVFIDKSRKDILFLKCSVTTPVTTYDKRLTITAVRDAIADIDISSLENLIVSTYNIETNYDLIPRYYDSALGVDLPDYISAKLYLPNKQTINTQKEYLNLTNDFSCRLTIGTIEENKIFTFDSSNNFTIDSEHNFIELSEQQIKYNIGLLLNSGKNYTEEINDLVLNLKDIEKETYLLIEFYKNEVLIVDKVLTFNTIVGKSLLDFSVNATNISAAIKEAGMIFSERGLEITNGNLTVKNQKQQEVFDFDYKTGELRIDGSGSFSGDINATSGSFAGITINQAFISDNIVIDEFGISGNYSEENKTGFRLSSKDGKIYTNDIVLNHSAVIEDYLSLGNECIIKNTANSDGSFISVSNNGAETISINANGIMKLGQLTFDGNESRILSGENLTDSSWYIDKNSAVFNNIVAKGALKTAVFEADHIQAIGGMVIIRPSSMIKEVYPYLDEYGSVIGTEFTIETPAIKPNGDKGYCLIGREMFDSNYYEYSFKTPNTFIILNPDLTIKEGDFIIFYEEYQSFGLSINSTSNNELIPSRSLALFNTSFNSEGEQKTSYNTILGELPIDVRNTYKGILSGARYGLYSESALIRGAVVSISNNYTSGINTESKIVDEATGLPVIFWAGAETKEGNYDNSTVGSAPFRIDSSGNLYANRGTFEGSILTNAILQASTIQTSRLIGNGSQPALSIYNARSAIEFYSDISDELDANTKNKMLMSLTNRELLLNGINFNLTGNMSGDGKIDLTDSSSINFKNLQINNSGFTFSDDSTVTSLTYKDKKITLKNIVTLAENKTEISGDLQIENNLRYGSENFEERRINDENGNLIGYDLYIL